MVSLENGKYIIGFDNGYQFGKTARALFSNGIHAMGKVEPSVREHSLKYGRKFYKVGEGRAAITEDKVSDEDARLLTMAAVAKELSMEGLRKAEVILAVGLPFSDYGREKGRLLEYYSQKPGLRYEYEGTRYEVDIARVFVFPQCYSAVAPRLGNMEGSYLIVDIGSKTTDAVYLEDGIPVERRSVTVERAMVKWLRQIQRDLQVQHGKDIPEDEILKVILRQETLLPKAYVTLIKEGIREQVHMLELELRERGYDLDFCRVIYVGGGAVAVRNFSERKPNIAYDCDIHANAKGYEYLALQILKSQGAA